LLSNIKPAFNAGLLLEHFKLIVNALFRLGYFKFNKCLLKRHFWTS
jgi:hypothetical protein